MKKTEISIVFRFIPVVTIVLIILLILCYRFQTRAGGIYGQGESAYYFSISAEALGNGHFLRLITANLFHVNSGHLLSNILGLLLFSGILEILVGRSRLLIIMLLSAISGTVFSLLFHMVGWMVGSSTILFGVFGGLGVIMLKYRRELDRYFVTAAISWCISLICLSTFGYFSLEVVDQGAHFGGIAAGILSTWLMIGPYSVVDLGRPLNLWELGMLMILLALFLVGLTTEVILKPA